MNLVGNAVKFSPNGGKIELEARQTGNMVRVNVRDNGPGIPKEEQQRIFDAFYRLRKSGEGVEGTGLGLAITESLIKLQGGTLGLESEPGKGSCFYFSLPVAVLRERRVQAEKAIRKTNTTPKILVIEDDATTVHLIESQLTSSGYEVFSCDDPERAVERAAELQPQAITLDLLMKPKSGWEILLQLKRDPRTNTIPVIVVTIIDHPSGGTILGADEYLIKPVDKATLLGTIQRCLERRGFSRPALPILVVEDDAPTREIVVALLTARGYTAVTAADGASARAQVAAELPELVILDLMLPKVSGFELLAEWRANPRTGELPVFVLTNKELTKDEKKYLHAHAESLFQKQRPWREDLVRQIERVAAKTEVIKA
jgi:DNA-binding response OmpR family regulator